MKIALLIAGYLRCFTENIDNIKKNIIQNNDCDIYIHITKDNNDLKYLNKCISIDEIYNLLNPKLLISSENIFFSKNTTINNLLNQNYKFFWLNEERKKICEIESINYDCVVKIRPDVNILSKLLYESMDSNYICIPSDDKIDKKRLHNIHDNHICDIIAYGSSNLMNQYFNYYLNVNKLIENYGYVNETLLYHYLNNNNILYNLINIDYVVILSLCNTIAITGDSGSGKTTISQILKELFNNSFLLECDRYHKWERGNDNWKTITHLNPSANYITKMEQDVFNLKIGNDIYQVDYNHSTGKFTDVELIESNDNIIVCGLHSLYLPDNIINLKIYMDTDKNLRIPWKIKRDVVKRGYTIDKIVEQINLREDDFLKFIYPQKFNADIIINFYTDNVFNINNFNINEENNVYLRIGIKNIYNISNLLNKLKFNKIETDETFIYIYFNKFTILDEYKNIIKTVFINLF
jgi:uridine kinase